MDIHVTVDITRALEIQGWMSEVELRWLAEQAQTHDCIVEVGSWKGRSTRALVDHALGTVYAVDHWHGQELTDYATTVDTEIAERGGDAVYEDFLDSMADVDERLVTLRMSSADAVKQLAFAPTLPNMVFLDGEHAYEGIRDDIERWWAITRAGGLLCGHDAGHADVKRAINEILPAYQVAPGTNIWWTVVGG